MNMSDQTNSEPEGHGRVVVVGPDGVAVETGQDDNSSERPVTEMVEQPAKVMRIGSMIATYEKSLKIIGQSKARSKSLNGSLDLASLDARCADLHPYCRFTNGSLKRLQVRQPASFTMRVVVRTQEGVLKTGPGAL